ncbi:type 4b pilus protein PilO2 [Pandoraea sputorum]|uniref:type 4b pilus protein PilO2 n=1 Tax=Pandoraea sputorum TaxID=93222 RepID=UPI001E5B747E|nr:type 4b pilus protein PilO2 [Pandoraea sputorum]MCE4061151.1 type 4b pilus protein PilO2 [Pandoraea sputorum]
MGRALSNHLVIGAQWETLIGLEKEMTEIRSLARSRDASHFVVTDDGAGTRTVGLVSLPDTTQTDATTTRYALAAVLRTLVDGPNVAFMHPDPDDPTKAVFVTLRDHRPELDLEVPASQLKHRLEQWTAEVDAPVKVAGVMRTDLPHADVILTLDDIAAAAVREATPETRIKPVRQALPARQLKIAAAVVTLLAVVAGAAYGGWQWYESIQREKLAAANRIDPVEAYKQALTRALANESFSTGASYARHLQRAVQQLPANAGGWRPASIDCKARACEIEWRRLEGGTFDLLLSQRPRAQIVDLDHANERFMLPEDDATSASTVAASLGAAKSEAHTQAGAPSIEALEDDGDARVAPIPRNQFLRTAGARLQALGDYGMDIALTMPEPLVPVPPGVTSRDDVPPPISKGEWKMAGHLAFFDSVAGLMMRAGNMSLGELKIVIDDGKPVFSAQGTYYVH